MSEDKTSVYSVPELLDNASRQSAFLIVISAKSTAGIGRMHKLDNAQEVILGRSTECQLQVDDDGISRRHARVGIDQNGRAYGQFEATGVRPSFVSRLEAAGIKLPTNLFQERVLLRD